MTVEVTPPMIGSVKEPHSPSNPHPLYGIDPNIMNVFGHTHYPKWVNGVLVKSEKEEKALESKAYPKWVNGVLIKSEKEEKALESKADDWKS